MDNEENIVELLLTIQRDIQAIRTNIEAVNRLPELLADFRLWHEENYRSKQREKVIACATEFLQQEQEWKGRVKPKRPSTTFSPNGSK